MRSNFTAAGLPAIPISISDMAYGWQSSGNYTPVLEAVDFFMINNFPYFAWDAEGGGSSTSWNDFITDMDWFKSVAGGRTLLVTQVSSSTTCLRTSESVLTHIIDRVAEQ